MTAIDVNKKQEPGWTWYIGHPIAFIIGPFLTVLTILDPFNPFLTKKKLFRKKNDDKKNCVQISMLV